MSKFTVYAKELLAKMTLKEKVAQMSQTVAGYRCFIRNGNDFEFNDDFKNFIADYGPMGAISNILRADEFTKKGWGVGIEPQHRVKVANQLQKYIIDNSRLAIPTLIEVEANHGLQALGSEMFPTNLGMGCMFNSELYGKVLETVGKETQLSANQMAFVTMLDMARDPRWGRTEEFFSEDPYLCAEYTKSGVKGFKKYNALICCKHFCATGDGFGGLNTAEVNIGRRELHDVHLAGAKAAVDAGADVFMAAYNTIDGIPAHANKYLLRDVLRDELGFDGIVLSDGWGVPRAIDNLGLEVLDGVTTILKAGVDLSLADNGTYLNLIEACEKGKVDISFIDEAVLRILEKKYQLGLFDNPYVEDNGEIAAYLKSGEQAKLSYEAATESIVLLKNNGILPLKAKSKVALFGCHADNIYHLLGDYTALQKTEECKTLKNVFENGFESVQFANGWEFNRRTDDFEKAKETLLNSDVAVVTVGGTSASAIAGVEFDKNTGAALSMRNFSDCGEGRDVSSIKLPGNQIEFIKMLKETGKPVVALLVGGRPYELTEIDSICDAVLTCFYPGLRGADAVFDVITGKVNPSGKLSVSFPCKDTSLPCYYNRYARNIKNAKPGAYNGTYQDDLERVLYPFGYGLSYSTFEYKDIEVTKIEKNNFEVKVTVENTSDIAGKEVVQLYIHGSGNSVRRRSMELKGFKKVIIAPHETKTVIFNLGFDELKVYNVDEQYVVERGQVDIFVGSNPNLPLTATIFTE